MRRLERIEAACRVLESFARSTLARGLACCPAFRIDTPTILDTPHAFGLSKQPRRGGGAPAGPDFAAPGSSRGLHGFGSGSNQMTNKGIRNARTAHPGAIYPATGQGSSVGSGAGAGRRAGPGARFACRGGSFSTSPQPQPGPPRHTSTHPLGSIPNPLDPEPSSQTTLSTVHD